MSAEGKKKRGVSGASNAKGIPFRYHGRKPREYHNNRIDGRAQHPCGAGSRLVNAMRLGMLLPGFNPSQRLLDLTDEAMARCTSPILK